MVRCIAIGVTVVFLLPLSAHAATMSGVDHAAIDVLANQASKTLNYLDAAEAPISRALERTHTPADQHALMQEFVCYENLAQDALALVQFINEVTTVSLIDSMLRDNLDDATTVGVLKIQMERLKGILATRHTADTLPAVCLANPTIQNGARQFLDVIDATDRTLTPIAIRVGVR